MPGPRPGMIVSLPARVSHMSLERILARKASSTSLARRRHAKVYGQDVPNYAFLFELLSTSVPMTFLGRFPARREEVVNPAQVLGNGILWVVAQFNARVARGSVDTPLTDISGVARLQRLSHSFGRARETTYCIVEAWQDVLSIKAVVEWAHGAPRRVFRRRELWPGEMTRIEIHVFHPCIANMVRK